MCLLTFTFCNFLCIISYFLKEKENRQVRSDDSARISVTHKLLLPRHYNYNHENGFHKNEFRKPQVAHNINFRFTNGSLLPGDSPAT